MLPKVTLTAYWLFSSFHSLIDEKLMNKYQIKWNYFLFFSLSFFIFLMNATE